jgi:hypothetical protein
VPISYVNTPMVAPFWADIDLSCGVGSVYYTLVLNNSALMNNVTNLIRQAGSTLVPAFALLLTYDGVVPYYACYYPTQTATFQLVLATDGFTTFMTAYYPSGQINWPTSYYWRRIISGYAQASGYMTYWSQVNALQSYYSFNTYTYYSSVGIPVPYVLASTSGNTNQLGLWGYTVGTSSVNTVAYASWLSTTYALSAPHACAPSYSQASLDNRFTVSSISYFYPSSWTSWWWASWYAFYANSYQTVCYTDTVWSQQYVYNAASGSSQYVYAKQQCCYQVYFFSQNGPLITWLPNAGTMMSSNYNEYTYKQQIYQLGWYSLWTSMRPISYSWNYAPPRRSTRV